MPHDANDASTNRGNTRARKEFNGGTVMPVMSVMVGLSPRATPCWPAMPPGQEGRVKSLER
jgi:hypothetical protein